MYDDLRRNTIRGVINDMINYAVERSVMYRYPYAVLYRPAPHSVLLVVTGTKREEQLLGRGYRRVVTVRPK